MGAPKWTDEEDALLLKRVAEGVPYTAIGIEMHKGRGAVIGRASRLKIRSLNTERYAPVERKKYPPKAPRVPRPKVEEQVPILEPEPMTGLKVVDLLSVHCRWPIGDPMHPSFSFCGAEKDLTKSYCPHHHRISYTPPVRRPFKKGVRT